MTSRPRQRSLHVWLACALATVVAIPALVGVGAWAAAGSWQASREHDREQKALAALSGASLNTDAGHAAIERRFRDLGVEAQLGASLADAKAAADETPEVQAKLAKGIAPVLVTPGLESGDAKARVRHYHESTVTLPNATGFIWVPRESAATRWAIALGAGLAALAAALVAVVLLLRRWVLAPLARLAADAERIAGGELELEPVATRALEVALVGDAMHGMADGLRDALLASAAAERDRRFMVTAIAHDLRTPLFTLRGSLEALERGIGDGRYLQRAQDRAAHLDRLVTDLFTFSRLEYAGETIAFDRVDVAALARRAAEAVEPVAAASGRAIEVADGHQELAVRGDPEALLRVLTNLLDNAIRHASSRVEIAAQRRNGAVEVHVADDGPGFAAADLPHVFEPLFRSDRARVSSGAGSGLGLAIARRLARAHGGDVHAGNDPEGGARLTVELPPA